MSVFSLLQKVTVSHERAVIKLGRFWRWTLVPALRSVAQVFVAVLVALLVENQLTPGPIVSARAASISLGSVIGLWLFFTFLRNWDLRNRGFLVYVAGLQGSFADDWLNAPTLQRWWQRRNLRINLGQGSPSHSEAAVGAARLIDSATLRAPVDVVHIVPNMLWPLGLLTGFNAHIDFESRLAELSPGPIAGAGVARSGGQDPPRPTQRLIDAVSVEALLSKRMAPQAVRCAASSPETRPSTTILLLVEVSGQISRDDADFASAVGEYEECRVLSRLPTSWSGEEVELLRVPDWPPIEYVESDGRFGPDLEKRKDFENASAYAAAAIQGALQDASRTVILAARVPKVLSVAVGFLLQSGPVGLEKLQFAVRGRDPRYWSCFPATDQRSGEESTCPS